MPQGLMGSLRSRNISEVITERIASAILNGDLKPGDRIPTEEEFAERIGVGKSSVREAIKVLVALGVLEIRRGDGTYVVDGFRSSMIDPIVYGILLNGKNARDVIDFKVRVQRMAIDDLLGNAEVEVLRQEYLILLSNGDARITDEQLEHYEMRLAGLVFNPLVAELYRQSVRIASPYHWCTFVHGGNEGMSADVWFGCYLDALAQAALNRAEELLALEFEALVMMAGQNGDN